jgi:D-xylose transport system ATP-binding protein
MVFVPEDRKHASIFPMRSLAENLAQTRLSLRNAFRMVNYHEEKSLNEKSIKQLRVKTNSLERTIETLSGGNQQKIILGRALQAHPKIILLDEPTRGVDVGAKYEIYEILFDLAAQGYGLLVVSGELPELMGICDRIGVMHMGRLTRTLDRKDFDARKIMEAAVGSGGTASHPAPPSKFSPSHAPRLTNQPEGFLHQ